MNLLDVLTDAGTLSCYQSINFYHNNKSSLSAYDELCLWLWGARIKIKASIN